MPENSPPQLGRRERQILDIVYEMGEASVNDVLDRLADPPSYSSVRAMLGVLERKGHVKHRRDKLTYIYMPTVAREKASSMALEHLLKTFFDGCPTQAVAALLDSSARRMTENDFADLEKLIKQARREGR